MLFNPFFKDGCFIICLDKFLLELDGGRCLFVGGSSAAVAIFLFLLASRWDTMNKIGGRGGRLENIGAYLLMRQCFIVGVSQIPANIPWLGIFGVTLENRQNGDKILLWKFQTIDNMEGQHVWWGHLDVTVRTNDIGEPDD